MHDFGDVLGAMAARKRTDVRARLRGQTLSDLRSRAAPTRLSLAHAIARPGVRFIMEVKKASPSGGVLARTVAPAAQAYAQADADAVSVLTDTPFFGGTLSDLRAVRCHFAGPILAKDIIVDPRQVPEARIHGADAVLVMLAVLDDAEAAAAMSEARRLGMDVLVEAHDAAEVRRAVALGAPIIGVNNRDLRTLAVDIAATERLASLVPHDRLLVSESGIRTRAHVERLAAHADAFLVGTALMRAACTTQAARVLAFGRVKVCGVTNALDAEAAAREGACFAGIVMVPGTPRAVTAQDAGPVAEAARRQGTSVAGVFRNEQAETVARVAERLGLDAVQLHGDEDENYIARLRSLLPADVEIWSAGGVGGSVPAPRPGADRTLFDTEVGGRSGGTGRTFDWSRIKGRREVPFALLAGGLRPANARAAAQVGAWALDVGTGVEAKPGRKDEGKLRAFFESLRPAARSEIRSC